jgi:hypothetical protein
MWGGLSRLRTGFPAGPAGPKAGVLTLASGFEPRDSLVYICQHPQRCIVIALYDPAQLRNHVHDFTLVCFSFRPQRFFDISQTGMDIAQTGVVDQRSSAYREDGDRN